MGTWGSKIHNLYLWVMILPGGTRVPIYNTNPEKDEVKDNRMKKSVTYPLQWPTESTKAVKKYIYHACLHQNIHVLNAHLIFCQYCQETYNFMTALCPKSMKILTYKEVTLLLRKLSTYPLYLVLRTILS